MDIHLVCLSIYFANFHSILIIFTHFHKNSHTCGSYDCIFLPVAAIIAHGQECFCLWPGCRGYSNSGTRYLVTREDLRNWRATSNSYPCNYLQLLPDGTNNKVWVVLINCRNLSIERKIYTLYISSNSWSHVITNYLYYVVANIYGRKSHKSRKICRLLNGLISF